MPDQPTYPITPLPFTAVNVDDPFWSPRLETNRTVTIPYDFKMCEETGRIDNFSKAAGLLDGPHEGIFYNDSDVFKVIEGAAYTLHLHPDPELDAYLDDLIAKIAAAQEADGYLYTARTIDPQAVDERTGLTRWSNLKVNHELYNVGHLYEAAAAHFRATGKRTLLEVALKNADLIDRVFGPDGRRDVPGHQEIEIGLVKLYRITEEARYLHLAKFFLDERGHPHDRELYELHGHTGYMQDHQPVVEQAEAVGHAVRAGYMYCGMADVAALTGETAYIQAIDRIWEDVVGRKLYLTGGIGALHQGEAFGEPYQLPNLTAYAETCAAIANAMWNHRMFLLHGRAQYLDVLERVIYNGFISGVSLAGDTFFYANPLASDGEYPFNSGRATTRQPWFRTSCCPTNVVRFIPSLPGYVYAHRDDHLYVNLYLGGRAVIEVAGELVTVIQRHNYPWDGRIRLTIEPAREREFTLHLRIPGWAQGRPLPGDLYRYLDQEAGPVRVQVNGEPVELNMQAGFARLRWVWQPGDVVELDLPMPIRRVISNDQVTDNAGRVALERGPLVYCVEGVDNGGRIGQVRLPDDRPLSLIQRPDLLGGLTVIQAAGPNGLTAIPYYAWSHRGPGEMAVWLPRG